MKSTLKVLTTALVLVLTLGLIPIAADDLASANPTGQPWTKYGGQLTMPGTRGVADAWVIKDGTTYKMWFTHPQLNETETQILTRINNLNPSDFMNDLLNKDYAGLFTRASGLPAADVVGLIDSATAVIGYAESADGISWTVKSYDVLADGGGMLSGEGAPTVIQTGGTYEMWYTRAESDLTVGDWTNILNGFGGNQAQRQAAVETIMQGVRTVIGHATSADGENWVDTGQVFPAVDGDIGGSVGAASVIKDGATYKMWYTTVTSDLTESQVAGILTDVNNLGVDAGEGVLDGTATVIGYATSPNGTDWTIINPEALTGDGTAWNSLGDPCVVMTGPSSYHMWYTRARTNLVVATALNLWYELLTFDLTDIWNALATQDLGDMLNAILALDLTDVKSTLANTNTCIGYASSGNGTAWTVQNASDLVGVTGGTWSSVGAPSVLTSGGNYEMWFTEGISDLTLGKLADLYLGSDLPIGRATAVPVVPPPAPPPPPAEEEIPGVTPLTEDIVQDGVFLTDVTAKSENQQAQVTVPEGTTGLTAEGEPLTFISVTETEVPPPAPPDHSMIALTFTFGPEGAMFDQEVAITLSYSELGLPEGFDENDLVIAVWDEVTGQWTKLPTVVDPVNNTVTTYVTGFSTFTILAATAPASFQISRLTITPDEIDLGEEITISALVENTGDLSGTYDVQLKINEEVVDTKSISLKGHTTATVLFTVKPEAGGIFAVTVNGLTGRFTVTAPPEVPPPAGPDIHLSGLSIVPSTVETGKDVAISVQLTNRGDQQGSYVVELKIDGVVVETEAVTLAAGESKPVAFTWSEGTAGIYLVTVDDLSGSFTVTKPEEPAAGPNWALIGGIIGGVVVLAAIAAGFLLWRRRSFAG